MYLGLFSPAVIQARIILQETWKRNLPWNMPVPTDLLEQWTAWTEDLPAILSHPIPRRFSSSPRHRSLHGFCDASAVAYGAALYLRSVHDDGSTSVSLVTAKARVAPVRPITIPKAELLGAHLLAKMLHHTLTILSIPPSNVFAWTDSEIVLYWLPKHPSQLDRFVANRVHAFQELIPPQVWRHVRSADNPADLASHGVRAPDLATSTLWWYGPPWLSLPPTAWPTHKLSRPPSATCCLAIRPSSAMPQAQLDFLNVLWSRFSSSHTLVRVAAWILRLTKKTGHPKPDLLSSKETSKAKALIFRLAQLQFLPEVFLSTINKTQLPRNHGLHRSVISLADAGHLVVHSRVRDRADPSTPKKLIPLFAKSPLIKLLIRTLHVTHSHAGISALHSVLAHTYYIPNLRNLLKQVSRSCPSCQRAYAQPLCHQMGMLPCSRTTSAPPFDRIGVDFAGPFVICQGYTRKLVLVKTYATVFIYFTTKAIHLDLCSSLSTQDFMATFCHFVARRDCPSHLYTDNGTNFLGAREEIRELQKLAESKETRQAMATFTQENEINWHNIPPRALHFGGLWEAAVRSMKTLLRKNLQPHALRFEELYTLLTDVEAILNSRPITPLHADEVKDCNYLTAGHFLIGRPLIAPPTAQPPTGKTTNLHRWNLTN